MPRQDENDDRIRCRAYELWKTDGCIDGRDVEHWLQAERELAGDRRRSSRGDAGKPQPERRLK